MKVSHLIQQFKSRRLINLLLLILLTISTACGAVPDDTGASLTEKVSTAIGGSVKGDKLKEVAPPPVIQQLSQTADQYAPGVTIVTPESDRIYPATSVEVKLAVQNLPIFKNPELNLGPHLELFVDNQFVRSVYDTDETITLDNLSPGTHTIRVFAVRPWHESYKNDGAYAQKTFHVIGKTGANTPDPALPVLTYNQPQGKYGAEPILLDFYLTNAPLHIVANADETDRVTDWRVKVTINGESFLLDSWQPVYLKGFQPGANWVQLEFIDDKGEKIDNVFNTTIQVIEYDPGYEDTLSRLTKGQLTVEAALPLVDANASNRAPVEIAPPLDTTEEPIAEPEEIEITPPSQLEEVTSEPEAIEEESEDVVGETESAPITDEPEEELSSPPAQEASEPEVTPQESLILKEIPDLILPEEVQAKNVPILEPIPDLILPEEQPPEIPLVPSIIEEPAERETVKILPAPVAPESGVMDKLRSLFKG